MAELHEIEQVVRTRLRSLRQTLGLSLDELAERANLSASTISRIETGKRTISLDVLVPLARALQIDLESLLDADSPDADVVIRPVPSHRSGATTWPLSRPTGTTSAVKMRLVPPVEPSAPKVHPGHDWFFVLDGTYGVSGAQPADLFLQALTQAWGERSPLTPLGGTDGDACDDGSCAV